MKNTKGTLITVVLILIVTAGFLYKKYKRAELREEQRIEQQKRGEETLKFVKEQERLEQEKLQKEKLHQRDSAFEAKQNENKELLKEMQERLKELENQTQEENKS